MWVYNGTPKGTDQVSLTRARSAMMVLLEEGNYLWKMLLRHVPSPPREVTLPFISCDYLI